MSSIIFMVAGLVGGLGLLSVWIFGYPFCLFCRSLRCSMLFSYQRGQMAYSQLTVSSPDKRSAGNVDAVVDASKSCTRHISSTTLQLFWWLHAIDHCGWWFLASVRGCDCWRNRINYALISFIVPVVYHDD